ncbi:MarR family winged helix-turn-helix transcriptional regulator [Deinococcus aquaedulcis]|uniref:MarR family winged helix-turn-helix transcriptional regulator n=1 Tax=Deinococcus aquaedulcis TaxID=2840455 RepID=UPI001C83531B|nr:MarR family transcriptional regulator [Deinococcus aquaedulcis]
MSASSPPSPDLQAQPLRFLAAYWGVWQVMSTRLHAALERQHSLDLRTFIALSYVQAGPITPAELARQLKVPRYEVARILRRLDDLHAIARRRDPGDARSHALHIEPLGQAIWASAMQTVQAVTAPALATLNTDLDPVTAALERLAALSPEDPRP